MSTHQLPLIKNHKTSYLPNNNNSNLKAQNKNKQFQKEKKQVKVIIGRQSCNKFWMILNRTKHKSLAMLVMIMHQMIVYVFLEIVW